MIDIDTISTRLKTISRRLKKEPLVLVAAIIPAGALLSNCSTTDAGRTQSRHIICKAGDGSLFVDDYANGVMNRYDSHFSYTSRTLNKEVLVYDSQCAIIGNEYPAPGWKAVIPGRS